MNRCSAEYTNAGAKCKHADQLRRGVGPTQYTPSHNYYYTESTHIPTRIRVHKAQQFGHRVARALVRFFFTVRLLL